jgi:iron complex outermembrane recepter protein
MKIYQRHNTLSTSIAIACVSLGMLASAEALAQEAGQTAQEQTTQEQTDEQELDTITVTVERREQDLQNYAGTAQALSQEDLRNLGIGTELRNLQVAVPGMSIANQEGNVEIFIRGVGSANNTELGDPGAAPHVNGNYIPRPRGLGTMFYDLERVEINKGPQGTLRGRNALAGTLNIVTKRPTLGGESSGYAQIESGNFSRRAAEFGVDMPMGDYAGLRFAGYRLNKDSSFENAGLNDNDPAGIQDETALRVSFLYEPSDRFSIFAMADYGHEGGTGYPGANINSAARAGADTGNFDIDDLDLRQVVYIGPEGKLDSTIWGFQGKIQYRFDRFNLEYSGSYRDVDFQQRNASSNGIAWPGRNLNAYTGSGQFGSFLTAPVDYDNYSTVYWDTRSQSQTHEVVFSSNDDDSRFSWQAGGFYFYEKQQVGFFSLADQGLFYSGTEFTMPSVRGRSWAAFGDGTFEFSDRFRIKGGLRYTDETKSRYGIGGNWTLGLGSDGDCCFRTRLGTEGFRPAMLNRPNFDVTGLTSNADFARFLLQGILTPGARDTLIQQVAGVIDGTRPNGTCIVRPDIVGYDRNTPQTCPANGQHSFFVLGIPAQQSGSSAFDFVDWRLGFEYDFTPDNLLYGTISTGHKAGGFNDSFDINVVPETFEPESILAFEIGSKNVFDLFGRRATFNASAFVYDYSDQVFQDLTVINFDPSGNPTGFSLVNRNVGASRLFGLELDSRLQFGGGFTLDVNALYLDTKITKGAVADVRSQDFGIGGVTSIIDLEGNELPLASKYHLNARLQQAIDFSNGSRFDWQILAAYRSAFFLTQYNNRSVEFLRRDPVTNEIVTDRIETAAEAGFPDRQDGFVQLNVGLGFSTPNDTWRFEVYGTNLLDEDVSQKALVGSGIDVRFLNDARSYGARMRYAF